MDIDKFGRVTVTEREALESLYSGKIEDLTGLFFEEAVAEKFNRSLDTNRDDFQKIKNKNHIDLDIKEFDLNLQSRWFMPEEYQNIDIEGYLVRVCPEENHERLVAELEEFEKRNLYPLLRQIKYLVDCFRQNNIVWGVGRGSSVASYVLFLLGVHKIDSIKYNLDIHEFFKGETENG